MKKLIGYLPYGIAILYLLILLLNATAKYPTEKEDAFILKILDIQFIIMLALCLLNLLAQKLPEGPFKYLSRGTVIALSMLSLLSSIYLLHCS